MQWHDKAYLIASKYIIIIVILSGCGSEQPTVPPLETEGTWQQEIAGVEAHSVVSGEGIVLAGTDDGAYRKEIATPQGEWTNIGLKTDSTWIADFAIWSQDELVAVVRYEDFDPANHMLFKSMNGGTSWTPDYSTELPSADRFSVQAIELNPKNPDEVFVYRAIVLKSADRGETWEPIFSEGSAAIFLNVSDFHADQIWAGGETATLRPYIASSVNGGESWNLLNNRINFHTDARAFDAILSPQDSKKVMVGLGGAVDPANVIRKTTDGGETWQTVLDISGRTFTHGARHPEIVYASGRHKDGLLFFAATNDFGESWEQVIYEDVTPGITINDLVAVESGGQEILYLATDRGLYSYTFTQ